MTSIEQIARQYRGISLSHNTHGASQWLGGSEWLG